MVSSATIPPRNGHLMTSSTQLTPGQRDLKQRRDKGDIVRQRIEILLAPTPTADPRVLWSRPSKAKLEPITPGRYLHGSFEPGKPRRPETSPGT